MPPKPPKIAINKNKNNIILTSKLLGYKKYV